MTDEFHSPSELAVLHAALKDIVDSAPKCEWDGYEGSCVYIATCRFACDVGYDYFCKDHAEAYDKTAMTKLQEDDLLFAVDAVSRAMGGAFAEVDRLEKVAAAAVRFHDTYGIECNALHRGATELKIAKQEHIDAMHALWDALEEAGLT